MLYQTVNFEVFNEIIDWCEENRIDYEIFNVESCFDDDEDSLPEIGMSRQDWEKWEQK